MKEEINPNSLKYYFLYLLEGVIRVKKVFLAKGSKFAGSSDVRVWLHRMSSENVLENSVKNQTEIV